MKALILSNTAGQGHNATGKAIMDMLLQRGAQCQMIDAYEYVTPVLKETVSRGYLISTAYIPRIYGRGYRFAETRGKNVSKYSPTNLANAAMSARLVDFVTEYAPDVIICTHVFAAMLVNIMKSKSQTRAVLISILTDFTIHPFWQDVDCGDYFVTASELLEYSAAARGMDVSRLLPIGIPIHPKFSERMDKEQARLRLGLNPDKAAILVMSGSMGYGNIDKTIRKINNMELDAQIIVVCGSNQRIYRRIQRMNLRDCFHVYGFVDNVDVMMDASDCIVTKPGGLTTSEALAKGLPMIMIDPIPGQEERNTEFMLNNGIALRVSETFPLDEALFYLFKIPRRIQQIRENISIVGKTNATSDLCDFIMKLDSREGG